VTRETLLGHEGTRQSMQRSAVVARSPATFSDVLIGRAPAVAFAKSPRASGARVALMVDFTPGPIDGRGAEADDLDGVARRAQFDCLGLSPQQQA
jgi:hypothetical protein